MTKWRTPEEWDFLRNADLAAYNLAIAADELERAGKVAVVMAKPSEQPALPAPAAAPEPEPAPAAQGQRLCRDEREALIKALTSVMRRYVADEIAGLENKISALDARFTAMAIDARRGLQ
jgi:hypothetical protein